MSPKLSDYVRAVISEKNLSSYDVEKRSRKQISFGYVNDIVNERTDNPSIKKLQALAFGLGVSEEELFRVARGLPIKKAEKPAHADLIEKFERLSEQRQQEILRMLDLFDEMDQGDQVFQQAAKPAHKPRTATKQAATKVGSKAPQKQPPRTLDRDAFFAATGGELTEKDKEAILADKQKEWEENGGKDPDGEDDE